MNSKKSWTTPTLEELSVEKTLSGIPTPFGEGFIYQNETQTEIPIS